MNRSGVTLSELLIAIMIISIGVLASIGSFSYIATSVQKSKAGTLSSNLAQEQIEKLKNLSYYMLLVTTSTYTDNRFSPALSYDEGNYPRQTILEGGVTFQRATRVDYAYQNGSTISTAAYTSDDTAIKQITVYVMWQDKGEWKSLSIHSLYANPAATALSASATGWVKTNSNIAIPGAQVQIVDNPNWFGSANSLGDYSFTVAPGSYTLQASATGYYTKTTSGYSSFTSGIATTNNFNLTAIGSGTVVGYAYVTDHLVISQVVASTFDVTTGLVQEYVELYNPTTYYIQMVNGMAASLVQLKVQNFGEASPSTIGMIHSVLNSSIPAHGYYLIANRNTINAGGVSRTADAVMTNPNNIRSRGCASDLGSEPDTGDADSIAIAWSTAGAGEYIDRVGWKRTGLGNSPPLYEGTALDENGINDAEQFVRLSRPNINSSTIGRAYDSGNNDKDFNDINPMTYPPHNRSIIQLPQSGTPATGTRVQMNDWLNNTATCNSTTVLGYATCAFSLVASTGTWTLEMSSTTSSGVSYFAQIANVVVAHNVSTGVPNAATTPTWTSVSNSSITLLENSTTYAQVSGYVYSGVGSPISGIRVTDGNGRNATTNSAGLYNLISTTGPIILTANPNDSSRNRAYSTQALPEQTFYSGVLYDDNTDFTLELSGMLVGYFQTASNTALPGRVARAVKTLGTDTAEASSGYTGHFYLTNLTTGTYVITPQLDSLETASPSSISVVLASTGTSTSYSTFTITSGIVEITGQVSLATSSRTVTTGALIVASTTSISTTLPPALSGANNGSCTPCYYAASSDATGNYSLYVRSSGSPYLVYGWYSTVTSSSASVSKSIQYSVAASTPGQIRPQNISW